MVERQGCEWKCSDRVAAFGISAACVVLPVWRVLWVPCDVTKSMAGQSFYAEVSAVQLWRRLPQSYSARHKSQEFTACFVTTRGKRRRGQIAPMLTVRPSMRQLRIVAHKAFPLPAFSLTYRRKEGFFSHVCSVHGSLETACIRSTKPRLSPCRVEQGSGSQYSPSATEL